MPFDYEKTPEFKRAEAFRASEEERYLLERTPDEMRQDLIDLADGRVQMAESLEQQAEGLRAEASEFYRQAGEI